MTYRTSCAVALLFAINGVCSFAAESVPTIPFKGDEVPLIRIKANPKDYVGKVFVVCGGVRLDDYYNYGYDDAKETHQSLLFMQASPQDGLPQVHEAAYLYLSRKVGAPITERIVAKEEKYSDHRLILVRATVTINPNRFDLEQVELFELLDVQFVTQDRKSWQKGVLAKINEEKQQQLAEQREREEDLKRQVALEEKKRQEALAPKFRVWKDKTEKHQTTAKFVSYSSGKVKLNLEDGKIIEVPVDALCKADADYIEERKRIATSRK